MIERSVSISALITLMVFGNSIGIYHAFVGIVLLVWLFVFFIIGDNYDMRNDVLASMGSK